MKSNEQARGTPMASHGVKVADGTILVGLSNVATDRARDLELLREHRWFDIPIIYNNGKRAILAFEKGDTGHYAFDQAFAA